MTITIDCRALGSSGVGIYLEGCLPLLLDSPNEFLLLGAREKVIPLTGGKKNFSFLECTVKNFSLQELFSFPKNILKEINRRDIYYSPYFNIPGGIKVPVFVTIHDVIFPDMPDLVGFFGLQARMFFYRRSVFRSSAVFTVSDFSKSRIEHFLGKKTPVINASNAINNYFSNIGSDGNKKKQIIFIGNIKKHKGLKTLLAAFFACLDDGLDYKLIIIGTKDNFRSSDKESAHLLEKTDERKIVFTGFIPDEEKYKLLAESALLVQPSLYEGFGYPPLEAMMSGTQALISDIPVFKEIYSDFPVVFFKSGDSNDLKNRMMDILQNKKQGSFVLSEPLRKKYSFKKTTEMILSQFKRSTY